MARKRRNLIPAGAPLLLHSYRFRDTVAAFCASPGGGTLYLTAKEARAFAAALLAGADSVEREAFTVSDVPQFCITLATREG